MRTERVEVAAGRVRLRSPKRSDVEVWRKLRLDDEDVFRPVEPTATTGWAALHSPRQYRRNLRRWRVEEAAGSAFTAMIELDGRVIGMVTVGGIQPFPISSCWIGYWVGSEFSGGGVATAAVALACDFVVKRGVHRIEATVLASNPASIRVLDKCGFVHEGTARELFHMDGTWRDHEVYARVRPDSVVERCVQKGFLKLETGERYKREDL